MTVVIPTGFASISLELRNTGDPDSWYITYGVDVSAAGGDIVGMGNTSNAAWADTWLPSMSSSTTLVGSHVKVGQDGSDPVIGFVPIGSPGASSQPKLPQNCALLVSKTSNFGGRRNRGRYFIPNILSELAVDNVGVIDNDTRASYQVVADNHLAFLETPNLAGGISTPMVILHNAVPASVLAPTPVVALAVDGVISTQRRRLR